MTWTRRTWALLLGALLVLLVGSASSAARAPRPGGSGSSTGYDVSYPQCNTTLPSKPLFAIVGVNDGRPWNDNPCLGSEYACASTSASGRPVAFYVNTANPGTLSSHWGNPATPKADCNPLMSDDTSCAYDYGWNAAAEAMAWAASETGTASGPWWLDVETANSWSSNVAVHDADLQSAVDYLSQHGASSGGFYSTASQWNAFTGARLRRLRRARRVPAPPRAALPPAPGPGPAGSGPPGVGRRRPVRCPLSRAGDRASRPGGRGDAARPGRPRVLEAPDRRAAAVG